MMGWWWFGGWMMFLWIVIIGLIVWGIVALTRRGSTSTRDDRRESPLDIAKRRYAKGEITKEEFDRIRKDLS